MLVTIFKPQVKHTNCPGTRFHFDVQMQALQISATQPGNTGRANCVLTGDIGKAKRVLLGNTCTGGAKRVLIRQHRRGEVCLSSLVLAVLRSCRLISFLEGFLKFLGISTFYGIGYKQVKPWLLLVFTGYKLSGQFISPKGQRPEGDILGHLGYISCNSSEASQPVSNTALGLSLLQENVILSCYTMDTSVATNVVNNKKREG